MTVVETGLGPSLGVESRPAFRRALLRWYDGHRRDLPWRGTGDPYSVWLSEIMLQQTRVAAVLNHYRSFLLHFPDIQTLAAASQDAVLAAWSGLGYYRRARLLHLCARQICREHGGVFPRNSDALRALPGIGRYTAAAIASIVFHEPVAVVDGNVERVLQRVTGRRLRAAQVWQSAHALLAKTRPGDFNQAMMELGAIVCLPRDPACQVCAVRQWCATRGEGPRLASASRQAKKEIWCVLDHRASRGGGKIRLIRRALDARLMPGMWELPQWAAAPRSKPPAGPWRTFRHSITATNYTVHVWRTSGSPTLPVPARRSRRRSKGDPRQEWIPLHRVGQLPITGLTRKILTAGGMI
jgi:A/G-specific adenine glycosylase